MNNTFTLVAMLASAASAQTFFTHSWSTGESMPHNASDLTATPVANDFILLAGGCVGSQMFFDDDYGGGYYCTETTDAALRYDPTSGEYQALPPLPRKRYRHTAVLAGSKVYLLGGKTLEDATISEVDVFDATVSEWTTLATPMMESSSDLTGFELEGKIYAVGGYDSEYNAITTVRVFDPSTETWVVSQSMGLEQPRGDVGVVVVDGIPVIFGGFTHEDFWSMPRATHEIYDPWSGTFKLHDEPASVGRGDKAVVSLHSRMLVFGGETKDGDGNSLPVSSVEAFELKAGANELASGASGDGAWSRIGELAEKRFRFTAASVGDKVYIFGGQGYLEGAPKTEGSFYPIVNSMTIFSEDAVDVGALKARVASLESSLDEMSHGGEAVDAVDFNALNARVSSLEGGLLGDENTDGENNDHTIAVAGLSLACLALVLGAAGLSVASRANGNIPSSAKGNEMAAV